MKRLSFLHRHLCQGATFSSSTSPGTTLLSYETIAERPEAVGSEDERVGVILHGLLGTGRNWRSFSKRLARDASAASDRPWRFLLVDLRCHGHSNTPDRAAAFPPPHTIQRAAGDVAALVQQLLPDRRLTALIGHSLGGKVVLEYLRACAAWGEQPQRLLPLQAWTLDSVIGASPRSAEDQLDETARTLQVIEEIPLPIPSRDWLMGVVGVKGFDAGVQQWLASNLVQNPGGKGFVWSFDLQGGKALYSSYQATSCWPVLESVPSGVTLNIVRAAESERWTRAEIDRLRGAVDANKAALKEELKGSPEGSGKKRMEPGAHGVLRAMVLPDAGHWVHADNPTGLLKMMLPSFKDPTL